MWTDESPGVSSMVGKNCKRLMRSVRACRGETGVAGLAPEVEKEETTSLALATNLVGVGNVV
jgi:hypothetical protein